MAQWAEVPDKHVVMLRPAGPLVIGACDHQHKHGGRRHHSCGDALVS